MWHTVQRTVFGALVLATIGLSGCSDFKESGGLSEAEQRQQRIADARAAVEAFRSEDPSLSEFFDNAAGYAVYPRVTKGGAGIGGAHGHGVLFEGGEPTGLTDLKQGTVGLQLGGQSYRQLVFFEDEGSLNDLKRGELEFSAQASAVAASKGAGADADYSNGVAVFTMRKGGLMFEASLGGQQFTFTPIE